MLNDYEEVSEEGSNSSGIEASFTYIYCAFSLCVQFITVWQSANLAYYVKDAVGNLEEWRDDLETIMTAIREYDGTISSEGEPTQFLFMNI